MEVLVNAGNHIIIHDAYRIQYVELGLSGVSTRPAGPELIHHKHW
jgi:hypothetical protein